MHLHHATAPGLQTRLSAHRSIPGPVGQVPRQRLGVLTPESPARPTIEPPPRASRRGARAVESATKNAPSATGTPANGDPVLKLQAQPGSSTSTELSTNVAAKPSSDRMELPTPEVAVRNLLECARFGHLCSNMSGMHHRRAGYPFGTLVDFATDAAGYPIFCLSPLAIHPRNLVEDSRTSFVVQMPGWNGVANAAVTIFGDVHKLPEDLQGAARDILAAKQSNDKIKERFISNQVYYRMNNIVDIYFVGGFGTVRWIDPKVYAACSPDKVVMDNPVKMLHDLNELYSADLPKLIHTTRPADDMSFIAVDAHGCDIRIRYGSECTAARLSFPSMVFSKREVMDTLDAKLKDA